MGIIDNPVFKEISNIFNDGSKPIRYKWSCEVSAGGEKFNAFNIMTFDDKRDYFKDVNGEVQIVFSMQQGDYDHVVFPNRENILVTITREQVSEITNVNLDAKDIFVQVYRGQLYDSSSEHMQANVPGQTDRDTSNLREMKTVVMQLFDLPIEQLRMMTVGETVRKTTTAAALRYMLGYFSKQINVQDEYGVKGVDIAEGFTDKVWNHVIIPHGVKLTGLGRYIQEKAGGVYTTGLGQFLQQGIWYVS